MDEGRAAVLVPPATASFPRLLIVDSHDADRQALAASLKQEGFFVEATDNGEQGLQLLGAVDPILVLLELALPDMPGLDVCREIRLHSHVPVIFVTHRRSEIDAVLGLEVGADDYVVKPVRPRELVARIRAVLRRCARDVSGAQATPVIEAGGVRLDRSRYEVSIDEQPVHLPLVEFRLLEMLLLRAGQVVERRELISAVWGQYPGAGNTLDTHMRRLRARIEADGDSARHIRTVRGVGYCFEPDGGLKSAAAPGGGG